MGFINSGIAKVKHALRALHNAVAKAAYHFFLTRVGEYTLLPVQQRIRNTEAKTPRA